MTAQDRSVLRAMDVFHQASGAAPSTTSRKKPPVPFSLRLTHEERAVLEHQAGARPLGAYIRDRLLGGEAQKRRVSRKPRVDEQQLAQVLAALGHSHLSSNLNQLAKAANMGTLPVARDVAGELREACQAVLAMRDALLTALGLKTEGPPSSFTKVTED